MMVEDNVVDISKLGSRFIIKAISKKKEMKYYNIKDCSLIAHI